MRKNFVYTKPMMCRSVHDRKSFTRAPPCKDPPDRGGAISLWDDLHSRQTRRGEL